jgi:hypothetical protein
MTPKLPTGRKEKEQNSSLNIKKNSLWSLDCSFGIVTKLWAG